jgi:hypothetical protein
MSETEIEERNNQEFDPKRTQRLEIYMPVVVLEGTICKATISESEEIRLEETLYVPVAISHSNKPYNQNREFYPEIMTIDYLTEFLKKIDQWGDSVINEWKK